MPIFRARHLSFNQQINILWEKNNMSKKTVKSGEKTDDSGIYEDGSGGKTTQVKGKTAPPTTKKNQKHKQKVDTNPKN